MSTSFERSQPHFTAIIYALKAISPEYFAKIARLLSEVIGLDSRTSSKNRKQFRQLGSPKVIKNDAIRKVTYDFLFDFQSNYVPISCRFGDIA